MIVDGINVLEFNYDFNLVNRDKLLSKYVDKEVSLKDRKTGEKTICRLLSAESGGRCVLEDIETREIYLDTESEIILPSLPSGLIVKPALVWKTDGKSAENVQVSYLSGMTFENAKIKLIAGEVNRIKNEEDALYKMNYVYESSAMPQAEEKAFFDYHMYTLNHPTTLKDNQSKQICIL